jgi:hypothetical protein
VQATAFVNPAMCLRIVWFGYKYESVPQPIASPGKEQKSRNPKAIFGQVGVAVKSDYPGLSKRTERSYQQYASV